MKLRHFFVRASSHIAVFGLRLMYIFITIGAHQILSRRNQATLAPCAVAHKPAAAVRSVARPTLTVIEGGKHTSSNVENWTDNVASARVILALWRAAPNLELQDLISY